MNDLKCGYIEIPQKLKKINNIIINTCFIIARNVIITDIDECDDENGDCDQTCVNEDGTYHCECLSGYLLDEDKMRCSGELMGGNNCTGVCY